MNIKKTYPVGLSTCGNKPLDEKAFITMRDSGIDVIELSIPDFDGFDFAAVRSLSDKYGVGVWSLHLPFMPFENIDISSADETVRKGTLKLLDDIIDRAADIGVDKFIVHPSGEPIPEEDREERMKNSMQSLDHLAERAAEYGAVIAVEDLPRTCLGRNSDEILRLISVNERLRVCFDVNHLLSEDTCDFAEKLGEKIVTLHISDYDFIDERHWLPGEGDIKWQGLLSTLEKIGYNGAWMYEVSFKASNTIERRMLSYSDFYDNAMSLFGGITPEAVGRRKL